MRPTSHSLVLTCALSLLALAAGAAPAAAQVSSTDAAPPTPAPASFVPMPIPASISFDDQQRAYRRGAANSSAVGARVFGFVDVERMAASQSFAAVVGTSTLLGFGAGADITGISDGLFVRAAVSVMSKSGTRTDGSQFSNGLTVNVRMVPIDLAAGWRFGHAAGSAVTPFVGGGALLLRYTETTPSGTSDDNVSSFFFGYEAFGGVDLRVSPVLTIAPEVEYRGVPNAIGKGGVSQDFNETNLGGLTFRIAVGARFGSR